MKSVTINVSDEAYEATRERLIEEAGQMVASWDAGYGAAFTPEIIEHRRKMLKDGPGHETIVLRAHMGL